MAKNVEHVSHIKSKLKTNGLPQLPSPDKLVDGEIAINYAEGVETISIRNENSAITTFSSDNYYTEKKLGSGFTNNDVTVTEAIDDLEHMVVNKEEAIAAALNAKTDKATTTALNNVVTAHTANTSIHLTSTEKGQLHTHTNKTYLDGITRTVGTMAYENASSYSSATQVSTALSNKVDKTEYATFSATTNTSIEDLSGQSETVAVALNDFNAKIRTAQTALNSKADKTAVDNLSRQIQTALNSKADKDDLNRQIKTIAAALDDLNARLSELSEKLK